MNSIVMSKPVTPFEIESGTQHGSSCSAERESDAIIQHKEHVIFPDSPRMGVGSEHRAGSVDGATGQFYEEEGEYKYKHEHEHEHEHKHEYIQIENYNTQPPRDMNYNPHYGSDEAGDKNILGRQAYPHSLSTSSPSFPPQRARGMKNARVNRILRRNLEAKKNTVMSTPNTQNTQNTQHTHNIINTHEVQTEGSTPMSNISREERARYLQGKQEERPHTQSTGTRNSKAHQHPHQKRRTGGSSKLSPSNLAQQPPNTSNSTIFQRKGNKHRRSDGGGGYGLGVGGKGQGNNMGHGNLGHQGHQGHQGHNQGNHDSFHLINDFLEKDLFNPGDREEETVWARGIKLQKSLIDTKKTLQMITNHEDYTKNQKSFKEFQRNEYFKPMQYHKPAFRPFQFMGDTVPDVTPDHPSWSMNNYILGAQSQNSLASQNTHIRHSSSHVLDSAYPFHNIPSNTHIANKQNTGNPGGANGEPGLSISRSEKDPSLPNLDKGTLEGNNYPTSQSSINTSGFLERMRHKSDKPHIPHSKEGSSEEGEWRKVVAYMRENPQVLMQILPDPKRQSASKVKERLEVQIAAGRKAPVVSPTQKLGGRRGDRGDAPIHRDRGDAPVYRDRGDAPVYRDRGDAPVYRDRGDAPVYRDRGDAPVYRDRGDAPVYRDRGDAPVYRDRGDAPVYRDRGDAPVYRDRGDAPVPPTRHPAPQQFAPPLRRLESSHYGNRGGNRREVARSYDKAPAIYTQNPPPQFIPLSDTNLTNYSREGVHTASQGHRTTSSSGFKVAPRHISPMDPREGGYSYSYPHNQAQKVANMNLYPYLTKSSVPHPMPHNKQRGGDSRGDHRGGDPRDHRDHRDIINPRDPPYPNMYARERQSLQYIGDNYENKEDILMELVDLSGSSFNSQDNEHPQHRANRGFYGSQNLGVRANPSGGNIPRRGHDSHGMHEPRRGLPFQNYMSGGMENSNQYSRMINQYQMANHTNSRYGIIYIYIYI